jgi:adenine-specific DNA-methyltransferase
MANEQAAKMTGTSLDIAAENRARLKELFPSVFAETVGEDGELVESVDFAKLQAELGIFTDVFENRRERYGMDWPGKKDALRLIQTPSHATLKPCREESVNFDTTEHLFVEGDNLEVLKLLQKSYYGKIKMIYIDPPYNTGKEFIYPDNYTEDLQTYLEYAGLADSSGKKFSTNTANEGRFHTKWLNMMYPRLYLARNLLRDDGVIFISIDDNEVTNLRKLCDEVFGEENFVASLVWDKNRKNDAKFFSVGHEYMLVYFKNKQIVSDMGTQYRAEKEGIEEVKFEFDRLAEMHNGDWIAVKNGLKVLFDGWTESDPRKPLARFSKVDADGPYRDDGNINWPGGGGPRYEVLHPLTKKPCKMPISGWRYPTIQRMQEEINNGHVVFGPDETTVPRIRMNLFENEKEVMRSVNFSYAQTATNEFNKIFDGLRLFENPKHFLDIKNLVNYICDDSDSIILDFFAGSATTAHAVLDLNMQDGGQRKFILVQLPEPCGEDTEAFKAGYRNIADIGKERIRRVIKKLNAEQQGKLDLEGDADQDRGFRVLKLDQSNFKPWRPLAASASVADIEQQLFAHVDHLEADATPEDLLFEILLKAGFAPTAQAEQRILAGIPVFSIAEGALLICLAQSVSKELIDAVVAENPQQFICLDAAFGGNDQLKSNAVQTFKAHNLQKEKHNQIVFKTV